jgi:hypothetical protein
MSESISERDNFLLALRPKLELTLSDTNPDERFQNETLRPVLKGLHGFLQLVFTNYATLKKKSFDKMTTLQKHAFIENALKADLKLRNQLLGIVIGQFTVQEYALYAEHENELARRVVALLIQRLQSVF